MRQARHVFARWLVRSRLRPTGADRQELHSGSVYERGKKLANWPGNRRRELFPMGRPMAVPSDSSPRASSKPSTRRRLGTDNLLNVPASVAAVPGCGWSDPVLPRAPNRVAHARERQRGRSSSNYEARPGSAHLAIAGRFSLPTVSISSIIALHHGCFEVREQHPLLASLDGRENRPLFPLLNQCHLRRRFSYVRTWPTN